MAAFNFNKTILGGRLTADPELKTTSSGVSVTSFTIAVNRKPDKNGESKADFFTCVAWRSTAEFITRYFRKASSICLIGSMQNRGWEAQDGTKRTATELIVDDAYFVDSKSEMAERTGGFAPAPQNASAYVPESYTAAQTPPSAPRCEDVDPADPDLPF